MKKQRKNKFFSRRTFALIVSFVLIGYSLWASLEWVAVVSILVFFCSLYAEKFGILVDSVAKEEDEDEPEEEIAPVESVEILSEPAPQVFQIDRKSVGEVAPVILEEPFKDYVVNKFKANNKTELLNTISDMSTNHIIVLLAIYKMGKLNFNETLKSILWDLRTKELIDISKDTLANTDAAWLSKAGREFMSEVCKA